MDVEEKSERERREWETSSERETEAWEGRMRSAEGKMHTFIQVMKNAFNSARVWVCEPPGYEKRVRRQKQKQKNNKNQVTCNTIEDGGTIVVKSNRWLTF